MLFANNDNDRKGLSARSGKKRPKSMSGILDYANMVDWVKEKNEFNEMVWKNKLSGETVPIRKVFHADYNNSSTNKNGVMREDGAGVDYLERLLSKGVSISISGKSTGGGYIGDEDFGILEMRAEEMSSKMDMYLRRKQMGDVELKGSEMALLRSELKMKMKTTMAPLDIMRSNANVFVVEHDDDDLSDSSANSDQSDTDLIADHIVSIVQGRIGNFVLEELMIRFGGGPQGKITAKSNNNDNDNDQEFKIEMRDEFDRVLDDFIFYYDKLEIPVSKLKIQLLRELLAKVVRLNNEEEEEEEEEDEEEEEEKRCAEGVDILAKQTQVYYYDSKLNELRDATVTKVHFNDFEPYYTILFDGEGGQERQTTRSHLTMMWVEPKKEEGEGEEEEEVEGEEGEEMEVVDVGNSEKGGQPRLEWSPYPDERGNFYFYNNRTGASTYMNPYVERGAENENDNDEDEDEIDETTYLPKDPDLLGFFVFCTVLVQKRWRGNKTRKFLFRERHGKDALHIQKRWRGNRSRNAARKLVAKTIRKVSERSERALRKTRILAMNPAKRLQT